MSTEGSAPKRGEVWRVNFDPTIGAEIRKVRPAIVVSSDAVGKLPVKLIAPITSWDSSFARNLWHVQVLPDAENGLTKESAVDTLQLRGADTQRFLAKLGRVSAEVMEEITAAIAAVIEFEPPPAP